MCLCTPVCVSSPHTHSCCSREICYFESTCRHGETRSDAKRRHCRNPTFQHADIFCVDTKRDVALVVNWWPDLCMCSCGSAKLGGDLTIARPSQCDKKVHISDTLDAGNALFVFPFDASFPVLHTLSYYLSSSLSKIKNGLPL